MMKYILIIIAVIAIVAVVVVVSSALPSEYDDEDTYDEWLEDNPGDSREEYEVHKKYNMYVDGSVSLNSQGGLAWVIKSPVDFRLESGFMGQIASFFKPFYVDLQGFSVKLRVNDEYNRIHYGIVDLSGKLYPAVPGGAANKISFEIEMLDSNRDLFKAGESYSFRFQVLEDGVQFGNVYTIQLKMPWDATYGV